MILTKEFKRELIRNNREVFDIIWIKGHSSDEAKMIVRYLKNTYAITHTRKYLIEQFLVSYKKMVNNKEIVPPNPENIINTIPNDYIITEVSKENKINAIPHPILQRNNFNAAEKFFKDNYFKKTDE